LEDHFSAGAGEDRDISHELDRIAETLLGVDQEAAAMRGCAIPRGLREIPL
jgi:hypothetical protein